MKSEPEIRGDGGEFQAFINTGSLEEPVWTKIEGVKNPRRRAHRMVGAAKTIVTV